MSIEDVRDHLNKNIKVSSIKYFLSPDYILIVHTEDCSNYDFQQMYIELNKIVPIMYLRIGYSVDLECTYQVLAFDLQGIKEKYFELESDMDTALTKLGGHQV